MRRVLLHAVLASVIGGALSFHGPAIAAKFGSVIIPVYFIEDVANTLKLFKNDIISWSILPVLLCSTELQSLPLCRADPFPGARRQQRRG